MKAILIDREVKMPRSSQPARSVYLFSGHMIDAPERYPPRFPPEKEGAAKREIAAKLDELGAGREDLAICGGACGGDILFAELALDRGLKLQVYIPFPEEEFLEKSVDFAGDCWRGRYFDMKKHPNTELHVMPEEIGASFDNRNPYERNNLWQLSTALSYGSQKVHIISLWDGRSGDGPGGTKHMCDSVRNRSGEIHIIDIKKL